MSEETNKTVMIPCGKTYLNISEEELRVIQDKALQVKPMNILEHRILDAVISQFCLQNFK